LKAKKYKTEPLIFKIDEGDALQSDLFQFDFNNVETEKHTGESIKIESLRHLSKPTHISTQETLKFSFVIYSKRDEAENDVINIEMYPAIIEDEEYMILDTLSKTPVKVISDGDVKITSI
jgi:hypothetical protein